jgi:hypothetical protein
MNLAGTLLADPQGTCRHPIWHVKSEGTVQGLVQHAAVVSREASGVKNNRDTCKRIPMIRGSQKQPRNKEVSTGNNRCG